MKKKYVSMKIFNFSESQRILFSPFPHSLISPNAQVTFVILRNVISINTEKKTYPELNYHLLGAK